MGQDRGLDQGLDQDQDRKQNQEGRVGMEETAETVEVDVDAGAVVEAVAEVFEAEGSVSNLKAGCRAKEYWRWISVYQTQGL